MRVHEMAKELGLDAGALVAILRYMGYEIGTHASGLDDAEALRVMKKIRALRERAEPEPALAEEAVTTPEKVNLVPEKVSFCLRCGKKFRMFRQKNLCGHCGAICCTKCSRVVPDQLEDIAVEVFPQPAGTTVCTTCHEEVFVPLKQRMFEARVAAPRIDTWPAFYRGSIPVDTYQDVHQLQTGRFRQKPMALNALRVTAAFLGCDLVYEVQYQKEMKAEVAADGQADHFPVWLATGIAGKRKQSG